MELLAFDFMQRAFVAGLLVALTCPVIGTFIVVRRQSLIGDGLGHIAFAGVCAGWLLNWQPVLSAALFTVIAAIAIEKVRALHSDFTDMVLAIFFYAGMALAIILASMGNSGGVSLTSFLFGSIVTVSETDLLIIASMGAISIVTIAIFYRQFVYLAFDEESASVSGLSTVRLNIILSVLTALTIAVSMRIVGLLLVSAMMVIPVACALPWRQGFFRTILFSVVMAVICIIVGLTVSYYADMAPGGTIILSAALLFALNELLARFLRK